MQQLDLQDELCRTRQRFLKKHPGLEQYLRQEKALFFLCGSTLFFNLIGMEWLYKALEQYQYITVRSLIFKAISVVLMFLMVQSPDDCIRYGFLSILADVGSNTCLLYTSPSPRD